MAQTLLKSLTEHHRRSLPNPYLLRPPYPKSAPPLAAFSTSEAPAPAPTTPQPPAAASSRRGKERGIWAKLLLFVPGAAAFGLGTWQIMRRQEKIELLEYRRKRLEMEPILWDTASSKEDLSKLEFRKVLVEGVFDEKKSIFIGPRSRSISGVTENGYYLITPLMPASNDAGRGHLPVLVNRGWVPRDWRNKSLENDQDGEASPPPTSDAEKIPQQSRWKFWSANPKTFEVQKPPASTVRVLGVIRGSENPSIFVPENCPRMRQWFYVSVPMMARECGIPDDVLYIEDIHENVSASNPYPVPRDVNGLIHFSVMPRDHLNYIFTWYTLSAAVTFMAFKAIRTSKNRR